MCKSKNYALSPQALVPIIKIYSYSMKIVHVLRNVLQQNSNTTNMNIANLQL